MVSLRLRRPGTSTNSSNHLPCSHAPTIGTKAIRIPHCTCTRASMRASTHTCQSNRNTPLGTRKSRRYLRTTICVCESPTTARSIAALLVPCCFDGWMGLVSDSGYGRFCLQVLCLWLSCCVCALILLPLALVVHTYVCGVVFLLCLRVVLGWKRSIGEWCCGRRAFVNLVAYALVGWFCRILRRLPASSSFGTCLPPPPTRFTRFQPR